MAYNLYDDGEQETLLHLNTNIIFKEGDWKQRRRVFSTNHLLQNNNNYILLFPLGILMRNWHVLHVDLHFFVFNLARIKLLYLTVAHVLSFKMSKQSNQKKSLNFFSKFDAFFSYCHHYRRFSFYFWCSIV